MKAAPELLDREPVVRRVAELVRQRYADRLTHLILFGSRARGEARGDSDWDFIALVDQDEIEIDDPMCIQLRTNVLDQLGAEIYVRAKPKNDFSRRTIFHHNVRTDGLVVLGDPDALPPPALAEEHGMKPETRAMLDMADEHAGNVARQISYGEWATAERLAYDAALAAARAYIFERAGKTTKTHAGTSAEFHRLWHEEGRDMSIPKRLTEGFVFKQKFDYTDPRGAAEMASEDDVRALLGVLEAVKTAVQADA